MITLILGHKGSGKTKKLISIVNEAAETSKGNVVCIEKTPLLTYDIKSSVRLIDTDNYSISGYDQFFAFIAGVCASDYDITDLCVDATLRIGGRDFDDLSSFLGKVSALAEKVNVKFTFTVSCDREEIPGAVEEYATLI